MLEHLTRRYASDRRGSAVAEFALWAAALVVPIVSVADVSFYSFLDMQLNNAAQAAAQAAWATCPLTSLPAATKCTGLGSALVTAAHSTGLGTSAALQAGTENYYCMDTSGTLQPVGTAGSLPLTAAGTGTAPIAPNGNCAAQTTGPDFTGNTRSPADYVLITVQYTYTPVFKGLSVLTFLTTQKTTTTITMSRTAWMRLA